MIIGQGFNLGLHRQQGAAASLKDIFEIAEGIKAAVD
jgi:hypothetical protein